MAIVLEPDLRGPAAEGQRRSADDRLLEAEGLARAIDLNIVHSAIVPVAKPQPATLFGAGKVEEIAGIEGFDEETAEEIQARAREHLEEIERQNDERRREIGVDDDLRQVPGITTAMMVALGEDDIKNLEDFAGSVPDDLVGWTERRGSESVHHTGPLSGFDVRRADAEAMIMTARLLAGWITEEDLAVDGELEEGEAPEDAEGAEDAGDTTVEALS